MDKYYNNQSHIDTSINEKNELVIKIIIIMIKVLLLKMIIIYLVNILTIYIKIKL